ncbi:MAG: FAD synthase [Candidatus Diapherotrites archaeon]|nr:FAD synthase [Candidatus Diapherotrites archaeon]
MRKVMAFGTFDLLHPGHLKYLEEAKKLGDYLVVVVTTDKNVRKLKGKTTVHSQKERALMLGFLKMVDRAVVGQEKDFYYLIKKFKPAVLALGYDQSEPIEKVKKELAKRKINAKVVVISPFNEFRFKGVKIRERLFGKN